MMTEDVLDEPIEQKAKKIGVNINPVLVHGLRSRMRTPHSFVILSLFVAITALVLGLVYLGFVTGLQDSWAGLVNSRQLIGKAIFWTVTLMEIFGIMVVTPGIMAGAISSEREKHTLDLLLTTTLPMRSIIWGKLLSGLGFTFLLILVSVPLQCIVFLFGGVTIQEVFISVVMVLLTAILLCTTALFFSSRLRSTTQALIWSYSIPVFLIFILPLLVLILAPIMIFLDNTAASSTVAAFVDMIVLLGGWVIISINPLFATAVSEWVWISNHSLVIYQYPLKNGGFFPLYSPWILFTIICVLLSLIFIWASIHFAGKTDQ